MKPVTCSTVISMVALPRRHRLVRVPSLMDGWGRSQGRRSSAPPDRGRQRSGLRTLGADPGRAFAGVVQEAVPVAPSHGLSEDEAARRLAAYGPNTVPRARPPRLHVRVLGQLRDPMILLLLVAGCVTVATDDIPDTVIIGVVVVLNTALGVLQEWRADRAIRALDRLAAPWAAVLREGRRRRVAAGLVVAGDLLVLEAGDVVAADGDLVEAYALQVDESAISGESVPRELARGDQVEAGTVVTRGRGRAIVTRTGVSSGLGRVAALVASAPVRHTPLQQRLTRLSGQLVVGVGFLASLVLVLGLLRGRPPAEMLVVALSLAVAAVPESLPAVVSISLAMGAHRMARRNAVVRRLPAVETLGSVTVLASDKTGTLTEGVMTVAGLWTPQQPGSWQPPTPGGAGEAGRRELVTDLLLCNDAESLHDGTTDGAPSASTGGGRLVGDPIEQALLRLGEVHGLSASEVRREWQRVAERPFDAGSREMTTVHRQRGGGRFRLVCKGAPESVLDRVADGTDRTSVQELADRAALAGRRVLLVAAREDLSEPDLAADHLRVVGLVALHDPPRASAADVVRSLGAAGIRMVLVTGDHAATGRSVAEELGLCTSGAEVVEGSRLRDVLEHGDVRRVGVFARIRPEQKVDIVRHLQDRGEVVAMTGDGVNDAPALRTADIGVAMGGSGTEVARQAAALVLADDDLRTVVAAVEEGRRIYRNIRTFLRYALAGGLAEVAVMILFPFLGVTVPLVPAQILWINMLTHGLPGVAFGAEPGDPSDMRQPSRSPQESILGRGLLGQILFAGSLITATAVAAGLLAPALDAHRQSSIFLALGIGQLSVAWALRSHVRPRHVGQRAVEAAVLSALAVQLLAVYVPVLNELLLTRPLGAGALLAVTALGVVPGAAVHLSVLVRRRLEQSGDRGRSPGLGRP
jgi:P-type Ca2+ transporter type 2C